MRKLVILTVAAWLLASCLSGGGVPQVLSYDDDLPNGKRSIAGSSEIIEFTMPMGCSQVTGVMLHGSRYGYPEAPNEDFSVTLAQKDGTQIHTEMVPYSTFERGQEKWYTIDFKKPVKVTGTFLVGVNFNAQQTKGVYVSFDTGSGCQRSYVGSLRDMEPATTGGEWMIRAVVR